MMSGLNYILAGSIVGALGIGWILVIFGALVFTFVASAKLITQEGLVAFYHFLPRRMSRHRVPVFLFAGPNHRMGPRFERTLDAGLRRTFPDARACACLWQADGKVRGNLRVWRGQRSALIPITGVSVESAAKDLLQQIRSLSSADWHEAQTECSNCNRISCPLHWRHISYEEGA